MSEPTVSLWHVPTVESPTARELRVVCAWGPVAARAVGLSLSSLGACPLACSPLDANVNTECRRSAETVVLEWGAPGPVWQLHLTPAATKDMLAGLLGCSALAEREGFTPTDRELLLLQVSELAQRLSTDLHLPSSSEVKVSLPADDLSLPTALLVDLALELRLHDRTHELHLRTPFAKVRPYLEETVSPPRPLTTEDLARAMVDVEAVLPGPRLAASELLGLRAGDVLCLGSVQQETVVRAEGVAIGRGRAGVRNGKLAVNLREVADPPEG